MPDDSMFTLQATDASEVTDAASADDAADAASTDDAADAAGADDAADAAGADDAEYVCGDCGRAFYTEDLRVLHRGVRHPDAVDSAAQEAYREAYLEEERAIRSFRIRALGVLVVLYFGLLFLYVVYAS